MGAALSLFVLMTLSFFLVRVASVALRLTGLDESTAKFQALSAVSGTGFTTSESEVIVNYPVRRKIITLLIIVGNLGLVTVLATVVVSFVRTEGQMGAVFNQVAWLLGVLAVLWFMILNKRADRFLCDAISRFLQSRTRLGQRAYHRLLQLGNDYSVCEHPVTSLQLNANGDLDLAALEQLGLMGLAVRRDSGELLSGPAALAGLQPSDTVVLYGRDTGHETLEAGH